MSAAHCSCVLGARCAAAACWRQSTCVYNNLQRRRTCSHASAHQKAAQAPTCCTDLPVQLEAELVTCCACATPQLGCRCIKDTERKPVLNKDLQRKQHCVPSFPRPSAPSLWRPARIPLVRFLGLSFCIKDTERKLVLKKDLQRKQHCVPSFPRPSAPSLWRPARIPLVRFLGLSF